MRKMTIWYRFRRRLVKKLIPKDLKVFCFHGMDTAPGTSVYDPETGLPWLTVGIEFCRDITVYPESDGLIGFRSHM